MEGINPNDALIPVYDHEEIIYVTPPEYYAMYFGAICLHVIGIEVSDE
jgi:hypothetical protein